MALTKPLRPLKTGNVRTYVAEVNAVAPADAPILAPEVDGDLDTAYASLGDIIDAVNALPTTYPPTGAAGGDLIGSSYPAPVVAAARITGPKIAAAPNGVATANLNDGAVTGTKIAAAPSGIATVNLNDGAVTGTKIAAAPSGIATANLNDGAVTTVKLAAAPNGVATANVNDGTVTRAKTASDCWLPPVPAGADVGKLLSVAAGPTLAWATPAAGVWTDAGATLTPTDATKTVVVPGPTTGSVGVAYQWGTGTMKCRLRADANGTIDIMTNRTGAAGDTSDDPARPSWAINMSPWSDLLTVWRRPTQAGAWTQLFTVDSTGNLGAAGATHTLGTAGLDARVLFAQRMYFKAAWGNFFDIAVNDTPAALNFTQGLPGWLMRWDYQATGNITLMHRNAGAASIDGFSHCVWYGNGDIQIGGANATKASGTTWINPSDDRLKKDVAPYQSGLQAILALDPIAFTFNGKGGTEDGMRGLGFSAQAVQPVMPEMVSTRSGKLTADDDAETAILMLDTTALPLALVNAIKELAARLQALEAAP